MKHEGTGTHESLLQLSPQVGLGAGDRRPSLHALHVTCGQPEGRVHGVNDTRLRGMVHANRGFHGAASARRLIVFNILRLMTNPTGSIR